MTVFKNLIFMTIIFIIIKWFKLLLDKFNNKKSYKNNIKLKDENVNLNVPHEKYLINDIIEDEIDKYFNKHGKTFNFNSKKEKFNNDSEMNNDW